MSTNTQSADSFYPQLYTLKTFHTHKILCVTVNGNTVYLCVYTKPKVVYHLNGILHNTLLILFSTPLFFWKEERNKKLYKEIRFFFFFWL